MRVTAGVFAAILTISAAPGSQGAGATVPPGGVVRWQGTEAEQCRADGKSWPASHGSCWYPVDLLQQEGELTLERVLADRVEKVAITVAPYPYPVQELTVDKKMVELSEEDLARVAAENTRISALWDRSGPARFTLPLGQPLADPPRAKNFGSRRIFNGEPRSPHTGVDYSAARGDEVLSVAAGKVVLAEQHFFGGNSVFVDHGGGLISMYFHLATFAVSQGEALQRGAVLGTVGATGRATGPHLHFGLRWHGARIDPKPLMGRVDAIPVITTD